MQHFEIEIGDLPLPSLYSFPETCWLLLSATEVIPGITSFHLIF
jgi:hypothetical protein